MSKLDVYLRSIEKFGAVGAVLTSNQAVTLRFPTGDRHATQVTPHDLLVGLVREVASPQVLDLIDRQRPARFDYDSQGTQYSVSVAPRAGAWQVTIEAAPAERVAAAPPPVRVPTASPVTPGGELLIERGQYDGPASTARPTASGSALLDEITHAARASRATDIYLGAGAQPIQRVGTELVASGSAIDGDQLSREVGVVAPPAARAAWSEGGSAVFAYGDGKGRVRATLARDHRGPTAALRLLPDEVALERLGLEIGDWLDRTGLVVIAGSSGAGKTVTLAAMVRALGVKKRRVVAVENPIELVQTGAWISQREVGTHVASVGEGVAAAMRENADAIAIGCIDSTAAAEAAIEAALGGHLVLTTITAPSGGLAVERLVDQLVADRRDLARAVLQSTLLGTVCPIPSRTGRTFEVTHPNERRA
jgi:twitching motility protein PilT